MSGHTPEEVAAHVKIYVRVFLALMVLTVATVGVSYIPMPMALGITVALLIATFKASLVAAYFMHLSVEKRIIWAILALTTVFFFVLVTSPAIDRF